MNQTTIYIGIGVLVLIVIIVGVMMSREKTATKTETVVKEGCNLGYESVNGVCNFVACPSGFYNDLNEKKCKRRTKVCAPERTCETVTENPNADDCITDISRCCKENEFAYNNQCYTECPSGTIVSGNKCVPGSCPAGFYRSSTDKGGKYRDNRGICQNYNNAFTQYEQNYLTDANKQCKNVVFNPNADSITITNKTSGTSCTPSEANSEGQCNDKSVCQKVRCVSGYYDNGNGTCIGDCKDNGTNNINDTVNRRCVASCPLETYYNKIMNGSQVVKNECVNDCGFRTKDFFGRDTPSFNFKKTNGLGYCINCRQDQQYKKTEGVTREIQNLNDTALENASNSYKAVYNDTELNSQILLSAPHMNFYTNSCLNFS